MGRGYEEGENTVTDRTAGSVQTADGPSGPTTVDPEEPSATEPGDAAGTDATDNNDPERADVTVELPAKAESDTADDAPGDSDDPAADSENASEATSERTSPDEVADDEPEMTAATPVVPDDDAEEPAAGPVSADAETALLPRDGGPKHTDTDEDADDADKVPAGSAPPHAEDDTTTIEPVKLTRSVADAARGTRFAGRYRLEDRLSSNGTSATWRAVDEKLRRAVGIHLVAAGSEHARSVMAAARAAALVGDPRFVQVLDAAEEDGLVYVVKEWLPDADNLASLLTINPLPPHEAYEMARSVADAMAVAHRAGLSHLRLDPENVLRMHTGQYKIVGLSVEAALYGHDTTDAARDDTRAIGSLLYACLARRWPEGAAYGLPAAPHTGDKLCTPGQVKAHVHRPLESVAMRALGHGYKHDAPLETPEDVVAALAAIPAILPPEPTVPVSAAGADFDDEYTPTALLSRGGFGPTPPPAARVATASGPPPALGGGFGGFVKAVVAIIVLVAVVLATWQIAVHVNQGKDEKPSPSPSAPDKATQAVPQPPVAPAPGTPLKPVGATELSLTEKGARSSEAPNDADLSHDGNPATAWKTKSYDDGPEAKIRTGMGIIYDLGAEKDLRTAKILLGAGGDHTTLQLYAAPAGAVEAKNLTDFTLLTGSQTQSNEVTMTLDAPTKTRYVLVWMTAMPKQNADGVNWHRTGHQNSFVEVSFTT